MTFLEAIEERRSVRRFDDRPIAADAVAALRTSIAEINARSGLRFQLVLDEPHAFTGVLSYGQFSGVRNYIAAVGPRRAGTAGDVGYFGERLVLEAQTLGLRTCWVGVTFRTTPGAFVVGEGERLYVVIALGYGDGGQRTHRRKTVEQVSNAAEGAPAWFVNGVKAALKAPTAVNQQKFFFRYICPRDGGLPRVEARRGFSLIGYTEMDLGIARFHFEVGAGDAQFEWA